MLTKREFFECYDFIFFSPDGSCDLWIIPELGIRTPWSNVSDAVASPGTMHCDAL